MTLPGARSDRARVLMPLAVLVVGVIGSAGATLYLRGVQDADTRQRFTNRSLESVHALSHALDGSADAMRGVRGLFDGSSDVTLGEFDRFVDALDVSERFPGVAAVAFVRADDTRGVAFVEPADAAPALDGGTAARAAMERARDAGQVATTPPLRLPGVDDVSFLVYSPVYRGGGTPATLADRRAALTGWVVTAYRGNTFVAGRTTGGAAVEAALFHGGAATPESMVGASPGYAAALADGPGLVRESRIAAFGAPWVVRTVAPNGFTPLSYVVMPWLLLGAGVLLSAGAAFVLRVLLTARGAAELEVESTTRTLRANEERFRTLADNSPAGVFFADDTGRLGYANRRLAAIAGVPEIEQGPLAGLVHAEDRDRLAGAWEQAVAERSVFRGTYRLVRPDGTVRWVELVAGPTRDEHGGVTGWVGTANDVTDRVEAQRRTDRLTRMLEHTSDLVTLTDPDGDVVWANDAARRYLRSVGVVPRRLDDLVAPSAREFFTDVVLPTVRSEGRWAGDLMLTGPDGELPVSQLVQAHYGADGRLEHYSFSARDLSERVDYQTRLAHEVLHDRLTGLPNRALFVDRLTQSLARTSRRESLLAVLFVDLDRFQLVNDSLGHEAGDRLLLEVAARLQNVLRSSDTAARFGGDEFTLLCDEVVDEAQAAAIAQRVLSVVSVPYVLDGSPVHVTASVGIVLSDGDARPEDLLRDADAALHRAKDRGKARYELFDERVRAHAVARFETESALHAAIERGELRLHYQPEVCLRTGRVVGAEALVRWHHPRNGVVQPDEFVPLAEESGLIGEIGAWVLGEACRQAARWTHSRDDGEPFVVWVNLSPRQLAGQDVVSMVESALHESRVSPAQIGLEVTESALLGDAEAAIDVLARLRALGVRIVIDDFGTGYSSLAYLRRLPVDGVKIDKQFVAGLGTSPEDAAIVRAIVGMATALGLDTVAEGVESREHLEELVKLGCRFAQGYYFARPAPRQAIDALLDDRPEWPGLTVPPPVAARPDVTPLEPRRRLRRGQGA